jgi:hypothetical protein
VILFPIVLVWIEIWAFQEYRQRAGLRVGFDPDALTSGTKGPVRHEDVAEVRLLPSGVGTAVRLVSKDGRVVKLPTSVASLSHAGHALERTLVRHLAADIARRVQGGDVVAVGQSRVLALSHVVRGSGQLVLGLWLCLSLKFYHGPLNIQAGSRCIRRGIFGLSGFEVHQGGLVPRGGWTADLTPWGRLTLIRDDEIGLELSADDGRTFRASACASNAWPVSVWFRGPASPMRGHVEPK